MATPNEVQKSLMEEERSNPCPNERTPTSNFIDERTCLIPTIIYGYYPCRSNDQELYLFDESEGWNVDANANREPFEVVKDRHTVKFAFPRQRKKPHRALSDFFRHERHDVIALTCVSAGDKFSAYEKELYDKGEYLEYNMVHGFSVELPKPLPKWHISK